MVKKGIRMAFSFEKEKKLGHFCNFKLQSIQENQIGY
jgi:hypothetical protein